MYSLIYDFFPSDRRFARRLVGSPHPASFRFHLTMDTLAFGYILPTTGRIRDFHPLETCAARRTTTKSADSTNLRISLLKGNLFLFTFILLSCLFLLESDKRANSKEDHDTHASKHIDLSYSIHNSIPPLAIYLSWLYLLRWIQSVRPRSRLQSRLM